MSLGGLVNFKKNANSMDPDPGTSWLRIEYIDMTAKLSDKKLRDLQKSIQ
jgi:hypothetical protein